MNKLLKQQIVITATLIGMNDEQIKDGIVKCEKALNRFGLISKRGNPNIASLSKDSIVEQDDQLYNVMLKVGGFDNKPSKYILHYVSEHMDINGWQLSRLLLKMSKSDKWSNRIMRDIDRGLNIYTVQEVSPQTPVVEPVSQLPTQLLPPSPYGIESELPIIELSEAQLQLTRANSFIEDIELNKENSFYWQGRHDIYKAKLQAETSINYHNGVK